MDIKLKPLCSAQIWVKIPLHTNSNALGYTKEYGPELFVMSQNMS